MLKAVATNEMVSLAPQAKLRAEAFGLPRGGHMRLITTNRAFDHVAVGWRALEETCQVPPTVFQSYDWLKTWAESHITPNSDIQLFVVVGYLANRLVYAMPLCINNSHGMRILSWASQPIGQYGDVLCDNAVDVSQWTSAAVVFIKQQKQADLLRLRHVRATSNVGPHAERQWYDAKLYERAPAMDLTRFSNEAHYDARYDAEQRRRRKRIRIKIEKIGPITYEVVGTNEVAETIDQALDEKLKWLKQRGRYSTAFHCPNHAVFLKTLALKPSATSHTIITRLSAGGKPVSWEVGIIYQGTQYLYLTSHMANLTDLSPGRLTFDLSQRQALQSGVKTYDLMIPYDKHKESWATAAEPVNDFYLPLTLSGAFYGHLYIGWLRPLLRKAYNALPKSALQNLQKILRY